jgi:hypothetical protein
MDNIYDSNGEDKQETICDWLANESKNRCAYCIDIITMHEHNKRGLLLVWIFPT